METENTNTEMESKNLLEAENGSNESNSSSFEDLSAPETAKTDENNKDEVKSEKSTEEDEWMDVLGSGSLKKKIIKEGLPESRPHRHDICIIQLEGTLEDGTVVEQYDSFEIQIGDMEIVQGLDLILPLMNIGEVALVKVEPRLAYGEEGLKPNIPPNSVIEYRIELTSAVPEDDLELMPIAKRKITGNRKRERGNWWYSRNDCNSAVQCYRRALDYLDDIEGGITDPTPDGNLKPTDADLQDLLEDRMKVYNNMAAAQLKLEAYDAALKSVENVLRCQPNNVKALYRKAKILVCKNEMTEARAILKKALAVEPSNSIVQSELQRLIGLAQKQKNKEIDLAKRMLQQPKDKTNATKPKSSRIFWLAPLIGIVAVGISLLSVYKFKYV